MRNRFTLAGVFDPVARGVFHEVEHMNTNKAMEYENLPKEAQAAARRIAKRTGETPEQVARRTARSLTCRRAECRKRDILGTGMTGREALRRIARRDGISEGEALRREIAAHRAASRRGSLYRADIMG